MTIMLRVSTVSLLGLALLAGCASTESASQLSSDAAPVQSTLDSDQIIEGDSATLVVAGMSCPMCASNVDTELKEIAGVQSVEVDLDSGEVRVALFGKIRPTLGELAAAIDRSGFTLDSVKTP